MLFLLPSFLEELELSELVFVKSSLLKIALEKPFFKIDFLGFALALNDF